MTTWRYETNKGTFEIDSNRELTSEELNNYISKQAEPSIVEKGFKGMTRYLPEVGQFLGGVAGQVTGGYRGGILGGTGGRLGGKYLKEELEERPYRTLFKGATQLATGGISPTIDFKTPEDIKKYGIETSKTAIAETIGAGIAKGIGVVPKFIRQIADIAPETVKQTLKLSFKRIADPLKREARYFTDNLVPRIKQGILENFYSFTDNSKMFLRELGVSDEAINTLKNKGLTHIKKITEKFGGNLGQIGQNIDDYLKSNLTEKGELFDSAFNKSSVKTFDAKPFYSKLRGILTKIGAVDELGNLRDIRFKDSSINTLKNIYSDLKDFTRQIDRPTYNRYKLELNRAISGIPEIDRYVYISLDALRNSAKKAIPALNKRMADYAMAKQTFDNYSGKVSDKLLGRKKLDFKTINFLKDIDSKLPSNLKFYKDLNVFRHGDEILKAFDNSLDSVNIEKNLMELKSYAQPSVSKMENVWRLYNNLPDKEITNDALAHFLAKDLFQESLPSGFFGASGASRKLSEYAVRKGLELYPRVEKILPYAKKAGKLVGRGFPVMFSREER